MDDQRLRERLHEAQIELNRLDKEREVVLAWIADIEKLVTLRTGGKKQTASVAPPGQLRMGAVAKGPSMRGTVLRVLREANGEPLHTREILARAERMGASTESKDPEAVIDLMGYSLRKSHEEVQKVAGRTWRWVEG
jgi:hypothetical protein